MTACIGDEMARGIAGTTISKGFSACEASLHPQGGSMVETTSSCSTNKLRLDGCVTGLITNFKRKIFYIVSTLTLVDTNSAAIVRSVSSKKRPNAAIEDLILNP
jgi:hypothetical protein